jgi:aerobic carbon-monoxide dehydrogenase large subunit
VNEQCFSDRAHAAHSPLRKEDARLLRGRARFVDDVQLPRMVHGVFIRSPFAHAEIASIDASAALDAGALCVLTAADLPFNDKPWVVRYWHPSIRNGMPKFLPRDRVRYVGEPVAFLVAANRYQAEDLGPLVQVEYRPLPAVPTIEAALAEGATELHTEWPGNIAATFAHQLGNPRAALASASHRVRRRFHFARQTPLALDTRGIVADYDPGRAALTVFLSTQAHYNVRENLSSILDIPEYQVRVLAEDVGGGFGSKSRTFAEEIIVSHTSRVLQQPVKWVEDRSEAFRATTHSRDIYADMELACDGEGRFTALKALLTLDVAVPTVCVRPPCKGLAKTLRSTIPVLRSTAITICCCCNRSFTHNSLQSGNSHASAKILLHLNQMPATPTLL